MNARADLPQFVPAANPICDSTPEDTILQVHAVLGFLSRALQAMQEQDACEYNLHDTEVGNGMKLILDTCQAALGAHMDNDEGATA